MIEIRVKSKNRKSKEWSQIRARIPMQAFDYCWSTKQLTHIPDGGIKRKKKDFSDAV